MDKNSKLFDNQATKTEGEGQGRCTRREETGMGGPTSFDGYWELRRIKSVRGGHRCLQEE